MEMPQLSNLLVCRKRNLSGENISKCQNEGRENETTVGKQRGGADLAVPRAGKEQFLLWDPLLAMTTVLPSFQSPPL